MVGIFSKFSVSRTGHRRTQSALSFDWALGLAQDERVVLPQNSEGGDASGVVASAIAHGLDVAVEFKAVEHPTEPLDNDKPVQCPLPEPSILNDGRVWKERVSAPGVRRRADMPLTKEGTADESAASVEPKPRSQLSNRSILPSVSLPEHQIVNLLEERNASGN